ncbi:ATP-binding protein [Geotalea sp. SG265]|uniref:ATP-binding protein n=1 Tax=Geotalea sp. SG265 TaxID=2922867 RepID=UPI001FAF634C|nr:ATP-binding protein [Geotalea sp. SG265]
MTRPVRILMVEDSEEDVLLLLRVLKAGGFQPAWQRVETAADMGRALAEQQWDLVISDYNMPQFDALAALEILHESGHDLPFIIVSGKIGEDLAIAAMKSGAHDYLMKDNLSRLVPAVDRELREAAERRKHRTAQEDIRRGKMQWEAVFDAVSDLILITDTEGKIIRCNRRVISYFSCTYTAILGRNIGKLFYGDESITSRAFLFPHKFHAAAEEDVVFPLLTGWYSVASYPMNMVENGPVGIVFIIRDITKRKRMEEEKRVIDRELLTLYAIAFRLNTKQSLEKIMEELLFQLHNMLRIEFSSIHTLRNKELRLTASLGLDQELEKGLKSLPVDLPWVKSMLKGRIAKARTPARLLPPDMAGAVTNAGISAWCTIPLKIGNDVIGVMMVASSARKSYSDREVFLLTLIANQLAVLIENYTLYDQMREKAAELQRSRKALKENLLEVKRANIELDRLNVAKNNFIGMASHELKTPITSIMGGVQFLLKYSGLQMTPEQENILVSVYEGISQLRCLVENLLSISRIEAKEIIPHKKPLRLLVLCKEVYGNLSLSLTGREIAVNFEGGEDEVPVDESLVSLAVRNLLENAIKFTPDGGQVQIRGEVVEKKEIISQSRTIAPFYRKFPKNLNGSHFYRLNVIDNGIGIPAEEQVRIFEKFYGVGDIAYHSSGTSDFMSKGTGLGLSIVRGVMDSHGGLVWVSQRQDMSGSTFTLLFPMDNE